MKIIVIATFLIACVIAVSYAQSKFAIPENVNPAAPHSSDLPDINGLRRETAHIAGDNSHFLKRERRGLDFLFGGQ